MFPRCAAWAAGGLLLAGAATAATPTLVVAVDTSRSLRPATLAAGATLAGAALRQFPADTLVGVLAFDDAPRWLVTAGSPEQAAQALTTLAPRGNYTLLDDAIFTASRAMAPGGTILLLTDGYDENSATTVEDDARTCEAHGVRVVAVGAGRRIDERTLRRLALLTGGSYLGRMESLAPAALVTAIQTSRLGERPAPPPAGAEVRPAGAEAASAAQPTEPARRPGGFATPATAVMPAALRVSSATSRSEAAATPATPRLPPRWWWLALPLAIVVVGAPLAAWANARASHRTSTCRRCGGEVPADGDCPQCAEAEAERALQERLRHRDVTRLEDTAELRLDLESLATASTVLDPDAIEKTRVLADQSVLLLREPGETQRSFLLRPDGSFAIGRDPRSNTLALRDPALSARHFTVVSDGGAFYIVDLDSTNGTYLNRRRIRAARLSSGDLIQAGQLELEYRSFLGRLA